MLEHARKLLGKLVSQSSRLNWKVNKIQEDVVTLKYGFDSLEEDVTVLESASSELLAKSNQIHPCGGSGWQQVVYLDFSDSNTDCPSGWTQPMGTTCDVTSFPVDGEYSRVCGRITAYQYGVPDAFLGFDRVNLGLGSAYLAGVSLTHGGAFVDPTNIPTHIWSFANGLAHFTNLTPFFAQFACPCDGGPNPPPFVGNDYFCDTALEIDLSEIPGGKGSRNYAKLR